MLLAKRLISFGVPMDQPNTECKGQRPMERALEWHNLRFVRHLLRKGCPLPADLATLDIRYPLLKGQLRPLVKEVTNAVHARKLDISFQLVIVGLARGLCC